MGRNRANKSRFIADENIPVDAVELLRNNHSIDIRHITEVAGRGLKDSEVIELSAKEDSVIITFDRDFGRFASREMQSKPVKPYGLVILMIIPRSPAYIYEKMVEVLSMGLEFERKLIVKEDRIKERSIE